MKVILSNTWHAILRFDSGEDAIAGISEFAAKEGIFAAWVSAIGSTKEIEIGFYDLEKKEYENAVYDEIMELVGSSGTIAQLDGEVALHMHGTFGGRDFGTVGGHIHRMITNATIEVFVHKIDGEIQRELHAETGLKLLKS